MTALDPAALLRCVEAAHGIAQERRATVLASFSMPYRTDIDPLPLIASNHGREQPVNFWSAPGQEHWLLSIGCAREFRADRRWIEIEAAWRRFADAAVVHGDHRPALCGGFAFDPLHEVTAPWREFPGAALTLGRFVLEQREGKTRLIVNAAVDPHTNAASTAALLAAQWDRVRSRDGGHGCAPPAAKTVAPTPDDLWKAKVDSAVDEIRRSGLRKVVLARSKTFPVASNLDDLLRSMQDGQPDAYLFVFSRNDACFVGASPEQLIGMNDACVQTHALAGSAPRSGDPLEDERLGRALLASVKDRYEHALVVDGIVAVLSRHSDAVETASEPGLRQLATVQHLVTPISARVRPEVRLLALLQQLHPSPAVGGLPSEEALAYIRAHERLDRGWYAGPVGWIDSAGNGEFAVALRSALLSADGAALFAGAGIVDRSRAEDEFLESEMKMQSMASALVRAAARTSSQSDRTRSHAG